MNDISQRDDLPLPEYDHLPVGVLVSTIPPEASGPPVSPPLQGAPSTRPSPAETAVPHLFHGRAPGSSSGSGAR